MTITKQQTDRLAEDLKRAPFNLSPHMAYAVAAHLATLTEPAEPSSGASASPTALSAPALRASAPIAGAGYQCPAQRGEDPRGCWRVRCQLSKTCTTPAPSASSAGADVEGFMQQLAADDPLLKKAMAARCSLKHECGIGPFDRCYRQHCPEGKSVV